jgi:P-type Mg2+ transporter
MGEEYLIKKSEVFKRLDSSPEGLKDSQVRKKREEFGENLLKEKDRRTWIKIFFSQFRSPLVLIFIFATIASFFLREITDAFILLGVVLVNCFLGFYQEYKSERALQALKNYIVFRAKIVRDKEKKEVDVKELVPGDVVFMNIGDIVPADIRIIESEELYANESVITGESFPVKKNSDDISGKNLGINRQSNMLFMGSVISNGLCKGVVVSTGESTEFGKTAVILSSREPPSDFEKGISKFGNFLLKVVFLLTIFVFAVNYFLGKGFISSLLFAIAIAIGVTPELLPVIITISMSSGAINMAKKSVIVKRLESIEDLGNVEVLCTDKTGTLTENNVSISGFFDFEKKESKEVLEYAAICNSAFFKNKSSKGNIIDSTILDFVKKEKISVRKYERIEDIEFDHTRKRMSSVVKMDKRIMICKGSTESLLGVCTRIKIGKRITSIGPYKGRIFKNFEEMSRRGLRVICVSYKEIGLKKEYGTSDEKDLIFIGFITISDPAKESTKKAIEKLDMLGIKIKILTGDNEIVTEEVCKIVGLKIRGKIITGKDLENIKESEFLRRIDKNNVFTCVNPEQKYKIVSGLMKLGYITGYLGDGVNDAPALRAADVGITVESAVDVAKDSSDVILLKKNLDVLADGVIEGRKTFGNTTKYILNAISGNFGNMFTLSISSLYFKFIPMLPSQILLGNFISDTPFVAISADNVDDYYLKRPDKWNIKLIRNFMIFFGLISVIFDIITIAFVWFLIAPGDPKMFRTVWFVESMLSEIIIIFSIRTKNKFWKSKPSKLLIFTSAVAVILTFVAVFTPFFAGLFEFKRPSLSILATVFLILVGYFIIAEIGKKVFYKYIEKE